jgi:hypothetical protein
MRITISNKSEISAGLLILIISLLLVMVVPKVIQAPATSGPYPMNLTIYKSVALSLSNVLASNITYTNSTCSVTNLDCPVETGSVNNATWNNVTAGSGFNGTYYNITNNGNTFEDICAITNKNLTCSPNQGCGADVIIMRGNATWVNGTTKNGPMNLTATGYNEWTATYSEANVTAGKLTAGSTVHLRFWLKVPSSIVPGNYNATYTFCAVENGNACSC